MRIAVVVQRYGLDVPGGAELHARYVAEMLAQHHEVTVLTTTARDYLTWKPHFAAGRDGVGPVAVERFDVESERDLIRFAEVSRAAFANPDDAVAGDNYLEAQGPNAPALWRHLEQQRDRYDALVAFSYRYITTQRAVQVMPERTLLVPTAEHDPAIDLTSSRELWQSVAAIAFNTPEERAMLLARADLNAVASDVVGIGSRIPDATDPARFRSLHQVTTPYFLYVGRVDRNKGCEQLFDDFRAFIAETAAPHCLLLIGAAVLPIPDDPRVRHLGFLDDQDKYDALAGADALVVPSPYESLSMVALEAMALGVPVVVNGRCDVLRGQVRRSNAGLYYDSYDELFEVLSLLLATPQLRRLLGANGRRFYHENYSDVVVAAKLESLLAKVKKRGTAHRRA